MNEPEQLPDAYAVAIERCRELYLLGLQCATEDTGVTWISRFFVAWHIVCFRETGHAEVTGMVLTWTAQRTRSGQVIGGTYELRRTDEAGVEQIKHTTFVKSAVAPSMPSKPVLSWVAETLSKHGITIAD